MGKKKSSAIKAPTRRIPKLDKEFNCPFCSHTRSVGVKMDRVRSCGSLLCRICGAAFHRTITRLDEAIDVYGEWIDACVEANSQAAKDAHTKMASGSTPTHTHGHTAAPSSSKPSSVRKSPPVDSSDEDAHTHAHARAHNRPTPRLHAHKPPEGKAVPVRVPSVEDHSSGEDEGAHEHTPSSTHRLKRLKVGADLPDSAANGSFADVSFSSEDSPVEAKEHVDVLAQYRETNREEEDDQAEENALFQDDE